MSDPAVSLSAVERVIQDAVRDAVAPFADFAGPALTTERAARYLGISVRSLETLVSNGEIKPTRPTPGCRRFLREALDLHLRKNVA